jgi:RimJ/RimL family protein N-acetyltransferase
MTWSRERRLADGRLVALRLAGPDEVPAITRLYLELSPESFYRRFNSELPAEALVAQLASFSGSSACLVATTPSDPERVVAEARYVPIARGTAELALTVADSYQGAGLGHHLLDAMVAHARAEGLERLRAVVLLANTPMLRLLQHYGWVLAAPTADFSVAFLEISVSGGMPGWPADSEGRRGQGQPGEGRRGQGQPGAGRRVLVERRSWYDDQRVAALRAAGYDVRQCTGPRREAGRDCPLVTSGHCRLAEEADLIVDLLPGDEPECAAVLAAHRDRWPHRVSGE